MIDKRILDIRILFISYYAVLIGLFLYSFTQIDLNLTLSQLSIWQEIQHAFQYIGYFNRPLSTGLYFSILVLLFVFFGIFLRLAAIQKLKKPLVYRTLIFMSILLAFSYNAFSYDIFNYIFDARIVTVYNQNPYDHKALDYPEDPMVNFMRWTHRIYPYGPVWLGLTVPLSYMGVEVFLVTFFLFKMLMAAAYGGSLYFIAKILQLVAPKRELLGLVFFGLNPLVIIESLVSAHLDIVMIFFSLWSMYLLLQSRFIVSYLVLFLSAGIKLATGFLLPLFLLMSIGTLKKKIDFEKFTFFCLVSMMVATVAAVVRTQYQPWYLLNVLVFGSLLANKYYIVIPAIILSFFSLLMYIPFLYTGNWDPPIPMILQGLLGGAIVFSLVIPILYKLFLGQWHKT